MIANEDLVGVWSEAALHPYGGSEYADLVFKPDGDGRADSYHGVLTEVVLFTWSLAAPNLLTLTSSEYLFLFRAGETYNEGCDDEIRYDSDHLERIPCDWFRLVRAPVSIQIEGTPRYEELRHIYTKLSLTVPALHIDLGDAWPKKYGLLQYGVEGFEEPKWRP